MAKKYEVRKIILVFRYNTIHVYPSMLVRKKFKTKKDALEWMKVKRRGNPKSIYRLYNEDSGVYSDD